jgi:hypothetical protein
MLSVAVAAIAFGAVTLAAARARRDAAAAVAGRTERLLVESDRLNASLSDADTTAVTTFLTGGIEPTARRQRYLADLRAASRQLATLTQEVGNDASAREAVETVAVQLPVYTGLIEAARANNRQGFPVGAAYLRQASDLMRNTILPASRRIYAAEAQHLDNDYRSGVATSTYLEVALTGVLALAILAGSQIFIARRSNRIFNVPLVAASVVLLTVAVWTLAGFTFEQNNLSHAQRNGSDPVEALSAARILTLRAERDESLALVARGGGDQYLADFDAVVHALVAPGGLLPDLILVTAHDGSTPVSGYSRMLSSYVGLHERIVARETNGHFRDAVTLAAGPRSRDAVLASRMNATLRSQISAAQRRFAHAANAASSDLSGLEVGIPLLVVAAVALVAVGFRQRIGEYR